MRAVIEGRDFDHSGSHEADAKWLTEWVDKKSSNESLRIDFDLMKAALKRNATIGCDDQDGSVEHHATLRASMSNEEAEARGSSRVLRRQ